MGKESLGRINSGWSIDKDDHLPSKLTVSLSKNPCQGGQGFKHKLKSLLRGFVPLLSSVFTKGLILIAIFMLLGLQDAILTGMGY